MARDLLTILKEVRGTGAPEAAYTDGIYFDIVEKTVDNDGITPRLGAGMYGSMQVMYLALADIIAIQGELLVLEAMADELHSLYLDKATLDSIYADKVTLDSIFADKATLDSLYADKLTLDSLYADKITLDSIFADKATLDSLFTDKAKLDSIYADKLKLDSLYADKLTLDGLYASKAAIDSLFIDKAVLDSLYADKATLDSLFADKATLDSIFADKLKLDSIYADKATLDSIYADKAIIDAVNANSDNITTVAANNTNVTTTATNIASINTVAAGIADINNYADTYFGTLAVAPTILSHPALGQGDLYYDSVLNELRVYDGSTWKSAGSTINGTSKRQSFTATTSQTVFPITGGYDTGFADVYMNGVKLLNGVDVDVSSGTNVVLTVGATAGNIIDVVAYGAFALADTYTQAEIDAKDALKANITNPILTGIAETKVAMPADDIDLATGNLFTKTISADATLTVSNVVATGSVNSFILELTNAGSAVITWFAGVKWASGTAPTLTASGVDILGFYTHDAGTTWRGIILAKDSK